MFIIEVLVIDIYIINIYIKKKKRLFLKIKYQISSSRREINGNYSAHDKDRP